MALTEETIQDKIEVINGTNVQVRTATVIKKDGAEISRSFHRHVVHPSTKASGSWADTDISGESTEVQAICNAVWTDAVKTAFQAQQDAAMAEIGGEE
tara:strand:+ start:4368 stop:4661 length:294 start_codon:yes stop_codon:yes gene_type:complete